MTPLPALFWMFEYLHDVCVWGDAFQDLSLVEETEGRGSVESEWQGSGEGGGALDTRGVSHGRVRRKDMQYKEMKVSLRPHRRVTGYMWWEIHWSAGIWLHPEAKESYGRIWSRDCHAQISASGKLSLPAGRKTRDIRGRGLPVMCPQRRHPLSVTHQGRSPKGGFVVMQPHRKCLPEISCWPYRAPLKITQSCPVSENLTKEPLHWAEAARHGLVWHTCLTDWPQLGSLPQALCSYTQPLWSHTA